MMSFLNDVRRALQTFSRNPAYVIAVVLTVALGIGVNTTIFSVVDAVLLRPVSVTQTDRVVKMDPPINYSTFLAMKEDSRQLFSAMATYGGGPNGYAPDSTRLASITFVDSQYFAVLGVRPVLGRNFEPSDHVSGATPVAMVSDTFWRLNLQADTSALGRPIKTGQGEATIVGVLPRGFRGLALSSPADLFVPITAAAQIAPQVNYLSEAVHVSSPMTLDVVARLRNGIDVVSAETVFRQIYRRHEAKDREPIAASLEPVATAALPGNARRDARRFISLLAAVAGLVFLVACTSLAGLIVAHNERRTRETAVRAALGASRWRLVRGFATEIVLLMTFGFGASVLVSGWLLDILRGFILPGRLNIERLEIALSPRALMFAAIVATLAALVTAVVPAIHLTKIDIIARLKSQQLWVTNRTRIRSLLVSVQVAIAVVLVIGAGLFLRSLHSALATDVGFRADHLAFVTVSFGDARYSEADQERFYQFLSAKLRSAPSVEHVTYGNVPLAANAMSTPVVRAGTEKKEFRPNINVYFCGPDYFRTLGVQVLSGRDFDRRDVPQSEPVIIVSAALARALWPGQDAIGKELTFSPMKHNARVVGVAADLKYGNLSESNRHAMYVPWQQNRVASSGTIVVRTASRPSLILQLLRAEVSQFDRALPISRVSTVQETIGNLVMTQRLGASLLSWFSALAIMVALIGVYGLVSDAVTRRTQEIGVRVALGANPATVMREMILGSAGPAIVGISSGLAGGLALIFFARPFLFDVEPTDPTTFVVITALVLSSTLVASYIPARRAARIDPLTALRTE